MSYSRANSVSSPLPRRKFALVAAIASLFPALCISASAATFNWNHAAPSPSNVWSIGASWQAGVAPVGNNSADILIFAGDVGTVVGTAPNYTATHDLITSPALFNQIQFNATDSGATGLSHTLGVAAGSRVRLDGTNPQLLQNNAGGFNVTFPIELVKTTIFGGNGNSAGAEDVITLNGAVSGVADIQKNGTSTFRFGSLSNTAPSENTWQGKLFINDGTIRFNNNATTGRSALRANPVDLAGANSKLISTSEIRTGTLTGTSATAVVETAVPALPQVENESIVIHAMQNGTYAGIIRVGPPSLPDNDALGQNTDTAKLVIRGPGTQTFTGTMTIEKDVEIGFRSTLVMGGTASLGAQTKGAIVLNGGTIRLDNTTVNNTNRLRDADSSSTTLDTIGGGNFSLVGNASAASSETIGRVQLGSSSKPRSGALTINVTHNAGTSFPTTLRPGSLNRDNSGLLQFATVNFTANDGAGTTLTLGQATANAPKIIFNTTPTTANSLLANAASGTSDPTQVGWATVNGTDFASYDTTNGITAVAAGSAPAGTGLGSFSGNFQVTGNLTLSNASGYNANSLKINPSAAGQKITLSSTGNLRTNAILLVGTNDFTIEATGSGTLASAFTANSGGTTGGARYLHVANSAATLNISASVIGSQLPLVKAGPGTVALTNNNNYLLAQPVIINEGTLRATPGAFPSDPGSLPESEIRLRGGTLEIQTASPITFNRTIGLGAGAINWQGLFIDPITGATTNYSEDKGSGGLSARGADVTFDFGNIGVRENIAWESEGFVNSGYALSFGSRTATAKSIWFDNLVLTNSNDPNDNYNAREIRVLDNPSSTTDIAQISGSISGDLQDDLMKTGDGTLEFTGTNSFTGATLVREGNVIVNGNTSTSFITRVESGARLGGNGTVNDIWIATGGKLSPGSALNDNTGLLTAGDLTFAGATAQFEAQIAGSSTYDTVSIAGEAKLNNADLLLSMLGGYSPLTSDLFFLLLNDGTDATQGTFAGKANNAKFNVGGFLFEISYVANSATNAWTGGNDVAVRLVPEPGSFALIALASASLLARRRRRRA